MVSPVVISKKTVEIDLMAVKNRSLGLDTDRKSFKQSFQGQWSFTGRLAIIKRLVAVLVQPIFLCYALISAKRDRDRHNAYQTIDALERRLIREDIGPHEFANKLWERVQQMASQEGDPRIQDRNQRIAVYLLRCNMESFFMDVFIDFERLFYGEPEDKMRLIHAVSLLLSIPYEDQMKHYPWLEKINERGVPVTEKHLERTVKKFVARKIEMQTALARYFLYLMDFRSDKGRFRKGYLSNNGEIWKFRRHNVPRDSRVIYETIDRFAPFFIARDVAEFIGSPEEDRIQLPADTPAFRDLKAYAQNQISPSLSTSVIERASSLVSESRELEETAEIDRVFEELLGPLE